MPITYRKLLPADGAAYRATRLQCLQEFPGSFGSTYAEEVQKEKLFFETQIEAQHPDNFMMAAFDGDDCIGLCGFVRESKVSARHRGHIIQMCVLSSHQGKGIGRGLIEHALADAFEQDGLEHICLGVVSDNIAANRLYEQMGFVEYGLLPGYMQVDGRMIDSRLMIKTREG